MLCQHLRSTGEQPLANDLRIHEITQEYCLATHRNVLLQIWTRSTPLQGARSARRVARELAARQQGQLATLVIVPVDSAMPDAETRQELSLLIADLGPNAAALALVHEGTGFRAAALRAVLTSITFLAQKKVPEHVCSSVDEAVGWLGQRVVGINTKALIQAVSEVRNTTPP